MQGDTKTFNSSLRVTHLYKRRHVKPRRRVLDEVGSGRVRRGEVCAGDAQCAEEQGRWLVGQHEEELQVMET